MINDVLICFLSSNVHIALPLSDQCLVENSLLLFVQVAEKIQEELEDYRSREDEIKRMKSEMGIEGSENDAAIGLLSDNTQVSSSVTMF